MTNLKQPLLSTTSQFAYPSRRPKGTWIMSAKTAQKMRILANKHVDWQQGYDEFLHEAITYDPVMRMWTRGFV